MGRWRRYAERGRDRRGVGKWQEGERWEERDRETGAKYNEIRIKKRFIYWKDCH